MKESYYTSETPRSCILRETFNDEFSVRRNGGEPTDVTFENGVGGFNGTTSDVKCELEQKIINDFTVRIRVKKISSQAGFHGIVVTDPYSPSINIGIFSNTDNWYYQVFGSNGNSASATSDSINYGEWEELVLLTDSSSSPYVRFYINGVLKSSSTFNPGTFNLNAFTVGRYSPGTYSEIDVELFEIYNYGLSTEEVSNLYNNSRHIKPTGSSLLEITAERGVIEDRIGNVFTNTDVEVVRDGGIWVGDYNGITSVLELTNSLPTGDFTVCFYVFVSSDGTQKHFISANAVTFYIRQEVTNSIRIQLYDGVTALGVSSSVSVATKGWHYITATYNATTKTTELYIDAIFTGNDTDPSFTTSPTNSLVLGKFGSSLYAKCKIGEVIIDNTIWSAEDISRYYTSTKHKYGK